MTAPSEQAPLGAYYTPRACAQGCIDSLLTVPGTESATFWEPHAGRGAFVDALLLRSRVVVGTDLEETRRRWTRLDFLKARDPGVPVDWIVGNPPYSEAQQHVEHAIDATGRVSFLLQLGFLESTKRIRFFRRHPPRFVDILVQRPAFEISPEYAAWLAKKGKKWGTDSRPYAFMTWLPGFRGNPEIRWVDWK